VRWFYHTPGGLSSNRNKLHSHGKVARWTKKAVLPLDGDHRDRDRDRNRSRSRYRLSQTCTTDCDCDCDPDPDPDPDAFVFLLLPSAQPDFSPSLLESARDYPGEKSGFSQSCRKSRDFAVAVNKL